jgi:PPOX class probable F420-dependent enzyme
MEEGVMALEPRQKQFLDENPFVGVATTLREDGSPHATVVWVDTEDGKVSFNTARGRAKERHIARDPRASLLVVDPNNPYRWVAVSGHAELTDDDADPQIDRLAKKYLGKDTYPWRTPSQQRVKVVIEPERVDASGLDD